MMSIEASMSSGTWEQTLLGRESWLRGVVQRHLGQADGAEDLVQEILSAALAQPPGSEHGPRGDNGDSLDCWLRGLALNKVRMYRRAQSRRLRHEEHAAAKRSEADEQLSQSPLTLILQAERAGLLRIAFERLGEEDARLLRWKYLDNWDYARIAQQLKISRNVVAHRLREARDRLRGEVLRLMPTEGD